MSILQRQQAFAPMVAKLILHAIEMGYQVKIGEVYRPQATADLYANDGKGIEHSLHIKNLAVDLMLFKDGSYLTKNEDYRDLGLWWEKQATFDVPLCWGGRFGDGNHFSSPWQGVR